MNGPMLRDRLALGWRRLSAQARQPLGLALLAAVLVHALALSHAGLRRSRPSAAPAAPPSAPDDTPELLRFSRRAAVQVPLNTIPIPPASLLPPPPPPALPPPASSVQAPSRPAASGRGGRTAATKAMPKASSRVKPKAKPKPNRQPHPAAVSGPRASAAPANGRLAGIALPSQLGEARRHLESLDPAAAADGAEAAPLFDLWRQASVVAAGIPPGLELRRLPASAVQALGLGAAERRSARSGERLLLVWVEADQAWLLGRESTPKAEAGGG